MLPSLTGMPLRIRIEELNSCRDESSSRDREGFHLKTQDRAASEELVVLVLLGIDVCLGTVRETKSVSRGSGKNRLQSEHVAKEGGHGFGVWRSYAEPADCDHFGGRGHESQSHQRAIAG